MRYFWVAFFSGTMYSTSLDILLSLLSQIKELTMHECDQSSITGFAGIVDMEGMGLKVGGLYLAAEQQGIITSNLILLIARCFVHSFIGHESNGGLARR